MTSFSRPRKSYNLKFLPEALREWHALDGSVRVLLKTALTKRLIQPITPGAALHRDLQHCYKIKLRRSGYRLIYTLDLHTHSLIVLAVDKRENAKAYLLAARRLQNQ